MKFLENKIPPTVLLIAVGALMWLAAKYQRPIELEPRIRSAGILLAGLLAFGLSAAGVAVLRRARTTMSPIRIDGASRLVTDGIYRFTRNPMYVSLTILLVGWALYLSAPLTLLGPPLFMLLIQRLQITPEERLLRQRFGQAYSEYQQRVRRWL